jgi:MbtH protein
MGNGPFDDENGQFYVLVNAGDQYSIWPAFADIPTGWRPVFGSANRQECLAYVETNWTDMQFINLHVMAERPSEEE